MATDRNDRHKAGVIFLFGAGASVDAGIPDTYKFVELFAKHIEEKYPNLVGSLSEILRIRKEFNDKTEGGKTDVDVEQLLVTLEQLGGKNNEVLLDFYESKVFSGKVKDEDISTLTRRLQNFIRKTVVVGEENRLEYLRELTRFLPSTLEIFSVNYDTCVEQLCYLNNLKYSDGFDIYWNPRSLDGEDWDVKLFKMHGSVIWFESQTKEYVKIPVQTFVGEKETSLKLITGEDLEPLLIYPMQKWQYIEPLTELQLMFKKRLVDADTKVLVVVGYSFRDEYITRMLWDAARINADLRIVLVGPSAQQIFERKLMFLDDKKTPSRIIKRVVCLPYPFSTVIFRLKNYYLQKLGACANVERQLIDQEKLGDRQIWDNLLRLCIECEFSSKAESIFEEKIENNWLEPVSWSGQNLPERILLCMKAFLHSSIAENGLEIKWLNRVNKLLSFICCHNLQLANFSSEVFSLAFNLREGEVYFGHLIPLVTNLIKEIDAKQDLLGIGHKGKLDRVFGNRQHLQSFLDYLSRLRDSIRWGNYFELRKDEVDLIKSTHAILEHWKQYSRREDAEELQEAILNNEKKELEAILGAESLSLSIF